MELRGARVFLTGGGSGIGRALAAALIEAGAEVATCGRRLEQLREAERALPGLRTFACDLAGPDGIAAALAGLDQVMPAPDVLINNAGVMRMLDLRAGADVDGDAAELRVNLGAPIALTRALLPRLLARPRALIVNVTSGAALVPMAGAPIYSAAKAGLRAYTRALRHQLASTAVEVVEVLPPLVDTAMPAALSGTGGRMKKMSAEACAAAIVHGLDRGRAELYLGPNRLLRWADRFAPGLAEAKMAAL